MSRVIMSRGLKLEASTTVGKGFRELIEADSHQAADGLMSHLLLDGLHWVRCGDVLLQAAQTQAHGVMRLPEHG